MDSKQINGHPLISCIIPTYKRSETLVRAINSVLNQTYENIEVIVVDDNTPNDKYSLEVQRQLDEIKDDKLIYLQQKEHKNGAVARNYGVLNSKGDYIAFLDDDDEWHPNKLENQANILQKLDLSYGAISCLSIIVKNNLEIAITKEFSEEKLQKKILERLVHFNTSTVLFRKSSLIDVGVFNENLDRHQDLQLFVDFLEKYKIKSYNLALSYYHIDDNTNRPNTFRLIKIKKQYFHEIRDVFGKYSQKEKKDILAAHYFEIIYSAIKEKKILTVLKYILIIGPNLTAYNKFFKRLAERL